jgi:hypothetical protein
MSNPFQPVRAALVAAIAELGPRHGLAERIRRVDRRLMPPTESEPNTDYDGDPVTASSDIRKIVGELKKQKKIQHGTNPPGQKLKQSGKPVLPPNVVAAIKYLESALAQLKA